MAAGVKPGDVTSVAGACVHVSRVLTDPCVPHSSRRQEVVLVLVLLVSTFTPVAFLFGLFKSN